MTWVWSAAFVAAELALSAPFAWIAGVIAGWMVDVLVLAWTALVVIGLVATAVFA